MKLAIVAVLLAACGDNLAAPPEPFCDSWHQWGSAPSHTSQSCVSGQPLERVLADVVIDPLVANEDNNGSGALYVHYQTPLVDDDSVYVETKGGVYTPCVPQTDPAKQCTAPSDLYRFDTQTWSEVAYTWQAGALAMKWSFVSDWTPPPAVEVVFHAALVDDMVAIPISHGGLAEVDAQTGGLRRLISPFGDAENTYVVSPLTVDRSNIYYTVVQVDHDNPYDMPIKSWLVAVSPDGVTRTADFETLVVGKEIDSCYGSYDPATVPGPWPPPPNADGTPVLPLTYPCGPQIPGFNAAPGVAYDGTIYLVSTAEYNESYSYISSIDPGELSPNWSTSLRDLLHDGCGVEIPYLANDDPPIDLDQCRAGAPMGLDPTTGMLPAAMVDFGSTSSPVALPKGGVLYGALTYYNEQRGHLLEFDEQGSYVRSYDFGWDLTPAVVSAKAGDRIIVKDNHYGNDGGENEPGPFWLTTLDESLHPLWQFQNTEANSCVRQPDGTLSCTADHPNGFEWCVNAPAVDRDGVVYANSEDGNLYAITANGELRDRLFLNAALGASYTPLALDHLGRIYALNNGHMFVVGAQ